MKIHLTLIALMIPCIALANSNTEIINARQEAFVHIEQQLKEANDNLDGVDTDWLTVELNATQLQQASESLQHSFPQGSQEGSKASDKIWQQPNEFDQLMLQMDQGFETLYRATKEHNVDLAEQGIKAAQQTCRSCHRTYRSRW
ncbi:hypothetical protein VII00023_06822 [Vibrio ichthyoenteri ATCC 700023]|uniref:Cytochrome c n=1 Tax=Vibrio ichthyoenteri ATCC 700023 TaxID=870968 RepID=F9RYW8_9VIBR|nr:cytochrome c [Vibrio ichthyoenteri]EGU46230.1 hypothetical protein VII00023_06822 [Vibrio ichthyoenteri ATCC 700023]